MNTLLTILLSSHYPEGEKGFALDWLSGMEYMLGGFVGWCTRRLAEYSSFSWQVKLSVGMVVLGIFLVIYMLIHLYTDIRKGHIRRRMELDAYARYHKAFREIMENRDILTEEEINSICGVEKLNDNGEWIPQIYGKEINVNILAGTVLQVRLEMMGRCDFEDMSTHVTGNEETLYLPNIATLCKVTGVTRLYETKLEKRVDVIKTLQDLLTLTLPVTEGYLARYTGHGNKDIKYMARMCHVFCTKSEPYKYMEEDLKGSQPLWYPMMLHRLLGWLKQTDHPMPKFTLMAAESKNADSAAFLIKEISYWGDETEKKEVMTFLNSPVHKCVEAALKVLGVKGNTEAEAAIKDSYANQTEAIRRESLRAICNIGSGECADFFAKAFRETSSLETKTCALECLLMYGRIGMQKFVELSYEYEHNESLSKLIHEVESIQMAKQAGFVL